ncbi:hypothetical protein M6B38_111140 [Iris pallida]|uniref:Uncharacterized protein n=1 Tax=Iris pallida TaxID=29817 RepID=A0AAX6DMW0_IRIPA|nr:hypothetical protein M6B38_111140 [Iris pallida]
MAILVDITSQMASALSTSFWLVLTEKVGAALFLIEGFDAGMMEAAYQYLCKDDLAARMFIGRPPIQQKVWLDNFKEDYERSVPSTPQG